MNINKENINLIHVDVFMNKDDLTWSLIYIILLSCNAI